ncbi:MAG: hypothetical protein ABI724_11830 [Betaproteobacteria bacterium]
MKGSFVRASPWQLALAAAALARAVHGFDARAETYPSRAIRPIVPYPAAGGIGNTPAQFADESQADVLRWAARGPRIRYRSLMMERQATRAAPGNGVAP